MKDGSAFTLAFFVGLAWFAVGASPRSTRNPAVVMLPPDRTETIESPDGAWALIAGPISERTILLENRFDHKRTLIKEYARSGEMGWSPDSQAFFINDAYVSNLEDASIYRIGNREPLLLNEAIRASDKEAAAVPADHAYFQVRRWLSAHQVLVEYCGHSGANPARQFDFVYAVSLDGPQAHHLGIHRVSRAVRPLNVSVPDCSF